MGNPGRQSSAEVSRYGSLSIFANLSVIPCRYDTAKVFVNVGCYYLFRMDIEPNNITAIDNAEWPRAVMAANAWRGRCLDLFARSESAVSETLLVLANTPERGTLVRLLHLVGQRFEELANLIGPAGAFALEGKASSAALSVFRTHEDLRVSLCHGVGKVVLDQQGRWLLLLRTLAFRSKQPQRMVRVVEANEADEIVNSLRSAGQRLVSELAKLRHALGSA